MSGENNNTYEYEIDKVFEQASKKRRRGKKSVGPRNIKQDIEVYQVIGLIGCLIVLLGCFLPVYSVKFYKTSETLYYNNIGGRMLFGFLFLIFILIIACYHKFSIIPILFILTYNLSVRIGLSKMKGCYKLGVGYSLVMIGIGILILSVFLINTGYAKDSAFRHNAPVMKKDIIWICIAIALSLIAATIIKFDTKSEKYQENIKKYKEEGYMLGYQQNSVDIDEKKEISI